MQKKNVKKGQQLKWGPSKGIRSYKLITIKPVIMVAKNDFELTAQTLNYAYKKVLIKKGQKIIAHQALSYAPNSKKDNYVVEIDDLLILRGVFIDRYLNHLTNANRKPIVEWWVEIVGKGWLLIAEDNVLVGFTSGAG